MISEHWTKCRNDNHNKRSIIKIDVSLQALNQITVLFNYETLLNVGWIDGYNQDSGVYGKRIAWNEVGSTIMYYSG